MNARRRRPRAAPRGARAGIRVVQDAEAVFRSGVLAGVLSAEQSMRNWAGHYMYLFHDEDGTAWFKHRDTRVHVTMTARQCAAGGGA